MKNLSFGAGNIHDRAFLTTYTRWRAPEGTSVGALVIGRRWRDANTLTTHRAEVEEVRKWLRYLRPRLACRQCF